jgi:hypothetical protein
MCLSRDRKGAAWPDAAPWRSRLSIRSRRNGNAHDVKGTDAFSTNARSAIDGDDSVLARPQVFKREHRSKKGPKDDHAASWRGSCSATRLPWKSTCWR